MMFLKQWWPIFASSFVLIIGVLLFVGDGFIYDKANFTNPDGILMTRTAAVALQLVLSALSAYGVWKSLEGKIPDFSQLRGANVLPIALALAVGTDVAIGLILSAIGWMKIDGLLSVKAGT
jgi:hypothetical protein